MISKVVTTAVMLILGVGAFWLGAMGVARMLKPLSSLFMLFAGIVWFLFAGAVGFKWELVRDTFRQSRTSNLGVTSGPPLTRGMVISQQPRSGCSASPDQQQHGTVRLLRRFAISEASGRRRFCSIVAA